MFRRRPLARAAVVGGTAYVAGKAGAKAGANQAAEQQQYAESASAPAAPAPAAPAKDPWSSSRNLLPSTSKGS